MVKGLGARNWKKDQNFQVFLQLFLDIIPENSSLQLSTLLICRKDKIVTKGH